MSQAIIDFITENIETREGHSPAFVCQGNANARISLYKGLNGDIALVIVDKDSLERSQIWTLQPVQAEQPDEIFSQTPDAIFCNGQKYCSLCPKHGTEDCHVRSHQGQVPQP